MEQLSRLKTRITNLQELRELMGALRALAASHVQSAQAALEGIRQYAGVIENAIAEGVTLLPGGGVPAVTPTPGADTLVLIGSEHGFVGGFNERLMEHALQLLTPARSLAVVGQRALDQAREQGHEPVWAVAMATQTGGVLEVARGVASRLTGSDRAELVFAGYRRGGNYEVETRRVLPLDPALLQRAQVRPSPLHHLPAELLLQRLADEYLLAELTRAIMESFASENGARLRVMEAADQNIDGRLQKLDIQAHSVRQASITAELLDVIIGAEAIVGRDG
ncbi:MAG: F0F1 ATP synthase subunit gamma [Pseudomonadales bacterium]